MNKTRMGKRAASLLLSLVMMLSLLPTAAYATMGNADETQGAIVSENGTGVSDDSSSGNTDDLQVEDSKDSDGTGDQKVEGSNGSNTVGDTAGTEGGADPSDLVNGNDSADPQDGDGAVTPAAASVAKVGNTEYATLEDAIAALDSNSYALELLDETAWNAATPVYWAAGTQSGYVATLAEALTAAYKTSADAITIVCRPGADVGKLTHGHVADDITIYGNNAYISSGECELEVDTFMYSRETGEQVKTGGAYLEKDITVTAYELDNLGVWGERHTDHKVTVNLTDCDTTNGITAQRVYISGTTGVNDITLTGCDFGTKATSVYSNADGKVVIDSCSFTGAQVPVNFNHKANGTQTVTVQNSKFTNCGDDGNWKQFAAPVRFVNSGSGTMTTSVNTCTFTDTVGGNGDILLGDGREGQKSNDVALTVESTAATVQAQQPGYYGSDGTTNASKLGTKTVADSDKLTTSVTQLMPSSELTNYVTVSGIKGFDGTKFATFADAYAAIKPVVATLGLGQETPADAAAFDAVFTDISNGKATLTYTITGNVTYDETGLDHLLTMGRSSSHYLTNERHLINFKFVGAEADRGATLTVNSNITLPYEWWGEKITTSISFENLTITGSAPSGLFANQSFFEGIDFKVNNCTLKGIKIYNCANVGGSYTITNSKLDGTGAAKDAYAIHLQGNDTAPLNILIENNQISGYDRGVNIDQKTAIATISGNSISIKDSDRSCIQLTQLAKTTVSGNSMTLSGGNAITLHGNLAAGSKIDVIGNNITGTGYLIYDAANGTIDLTYTGNTVSDTIDTTKGVYGGKEYKVSENVANALKPETTTYVAEVGSTKYETLQAAIDAAGRKATVTMLADTRENVTISTNYLTLDLNGHTLNGGQVKAKPALTVTARVTVKDSSAAKTGTIMREDTAANSGVSSHYVIDVQGNGWLTFESGIVKNNSGTDSGKGASLVRVGDDSVAKYPGLNIKGGTFTQDNFIVIKVDRGDLFLNGGTLNSANSYAIEDWHRATIKGGTVNGTVAAWTYSGGHNSDLTISGGTVNGNVASVSYDKAEGKLAKVSISGGTVDGTLGTYTYGNGLIPIDDATKATIAVTGGTFSKDPTKYVVEDSAITPNADGTYGVAKAYLAQVGDTSYYTMDEAFKAQTASDKAIVLLRDYTTGSTFNSGSINRTVDLNGHTWTCTGTDANSAAFEINYSDASLTVKNGKVFSSQLVGLIPSAMGGTIKYDNSSLVFDGVEMTTTARSGIETNGNNTNDTVTLRNSTLNVPNGFGIYFPSSGTLTIDNSVINAKTMGVQVCAGSLNISGAGTAITVSGDGIDKTINDGAIEDGAAISIVNRIGYKGLDKIEVKGGTFTAKGTNAAVKAYKWENQTASAFDNSENVVAISGGTFSSAVDKSLCADGYIPTRNTDGTYGVKEGKFVAEIGSQGYESLQAAIDAARDGQTVTLLADATEDVVISKSITLDLGGKTLTNTNVGNATISVQSGTVTVKNGNVVGGTDYYNIEAKKDANLTLTDVTATAGNTGSSMIDNWGTLTITSGTYTGGLNVVKSEEGSVLNISGGTFTRETAPRWGITGTVLVYGTTTITGGTFNEKSTSTNARVVVTGRVDGYDSITYVKGGTFNGNGNNVFHHLSPAQADDSFEVSGGTFNKSIPDYYCADGFIPTKNAGGTYGVKEGQYVAKVGSTKYETLADAIKAAKNGKTVTLLADVEQNTQLTINKSITLDLNGKTIKNTADIWGDNANAILSITNGAKVTITGNGTIDAKENDCYAINMVKGDLTIENGTFYGNVSVVQVQEGTLSVKGGTFDLHQKWEGSSKYLINCIDDAYVGGSANVAISGGTFVGFDPNVSPEQKVDGKAPSFAAPGVGITKNENGSFTAVDGMTAQILDKDGNSIKAYRTLADAVAAAQDGQTVRLLADVAESSIKVNANITIDLNKMTVTGSFVTYGEVTIQNGTIDVPDGKTNYAYGKLTLVDVDITGKAVNSSLLSVNYNGSVTIDKDSTIVADSAKGDYPAVFIKGQDDSGKTYAPELNIYGTVQSAKTPAIQGNGTDRGVSHVNVFEGAVVKSESLAVYLPQPCEVNITGGLVEGYCGIGIKSGTLNISGGTVRGVANDNVIGDQYSQTNGISYDGSAIMIDSYIGYAGQVQINISGNAVVESKYSTAIREIGNDKSQTNLVGLDITGGTVLGAKDTDAVLVRDVTAKDVNISGGEFSSIVKKEYCAPGFTPVTTANSEGRYGVEVGKFTVMVTSRTTGSNSPVANVAGGGSNITYAQGTKVTASAISGYNFVGWFVNEYTGTPYSTDLTCEIKPTDDCTMIAVYEPISGGVFALEVSASKFTVNGGATQRSYLLEKMPVGTQVTVVFKGSENFLYWVNESGKVVSTSKTYTFSMGSATTLKAVYAEKEEHQAMVVFISHTQQVISSKGYTDTQEIQFPEPPIKMGATFVRWSMTEAEIRAAMATTTTGIIVVEPVYEFSAGSYTVTVNYPNDETATYTATVGKITTVTAKSIDGKVFNCWKNGDTVLGYTETLKIAPRGDLILTAEYVDAGTTVDRLPVIALTEISASQQGAKYAVSFTATRSVPEGYTVTEQGILVSTNSQYGQEGALDAMKLDANGAKPDDTFILKATNTDATGVTVLNGTVSAADRTVYGRAYMILRDSSGAMVYVYSDTILSGSYNSLTTNGGN